MQMKIVLDTNILFSILIKPTGKTYQLFDALSDNHVLFIGVRTLSELDNHNQKILRLSRLSESEIISLKQSLLNRVQIIYDISLTLVVVKLAYDLVKDIDIDDAVFVATTIHLDAILWSSDKPLKDGLIAKGFDKVYDSTAIQTLLS
jgi:predicted nucleic acid-binding protein